MNREKIQDQFKPEAALVIYACKNDYYIESHDIDDNGVFSEGTPLSEKFLQKLTETITEKESVSYSSGIQILPSNLLLYNNQPYKKVIGWWASYLNSVTIKISGKKYSFIPPQMLFIVINDILYVYCFRHDKKQKYCLYKAPYLNVYSDNKVCLGNVRIQKDFDSINEEIAWWEQIWWTSEFTGALENDGRATIPLSELWSKKKSNTMYKFLDDYLVPMNTTLEKIIKTL